MFKLLLTRFSISAFKMENIETLGIDRQDVAIVGVSLLIVLVVSILKERGVQIRETLARQNVVIRWTLVYGLIFYIIIFGAYGLGYIPVAPIYANF